VETAVTTTSLSTERGDTAFVLTGGGSLGAAQAGMLAALTAAGIRPDRIVGASAGAINAAFFAHDPSIGTANRMTRLWASMTTRGALGLSWRSILGVVGLSGHIASPRGLRRLLEDELHYRNFDEAAVPLHILCADALTGDEVVLSSGPVMDAVIASAAIPGVFPSVTIDGRRLVDGAVASCTPIATAVRLGAKRLVVLPAGFACALPRPPTRALGHAMHAITLLGARQLKSDFDRYAATASIHIVPPLCPMSRSAYDYSHGAEVADRAMRSTEEWIRSGGLGRTEFPGPLNEHSH
jgi:NTE family protein